MTDKQFNELIDKAIVKSLDGKTENQVRKFIEKDWIFNTGWNLVQSSTIHEIRYSVSDRELDVRFYDSNPRSKNFRKITQYKYYDVPPSIATDLLATEYMGRSVGREFYRLVKGVDKMNPTFRYKKINIPAMKVPKSEVFEERADNPNAKRVKITNRNRNIVDRSELMRVAWRYIKTYNVDLKEAIKMAYEELG